MLECVFKLKGCNSLINFIYILLLVNLGLESIFSLWGLDFLINNNGITLIEGIIYAFGYVT